ncbi:MAG: pyrroloquinoline quinone-dependent dehydrogenase [Acidobacteria bacterium]|nr:pyrroloquinoline quinone-dependent dehydrogenase [Acidobacteriota bacterium]
MLGLPHSLVFPRALVAVAVLVTVSLSPAGAPPSTSGVTQGEWRVYGGDPGGSRFSSLDQINRRNVATLAPAWTYHTGEVSPDAKSTPARRLSAFESTPLMVDGALFLSTPSDRIVALDPETGKEIWTFDPKTPGRTVRSHQHRGVAYWEGPATKRSGVDKRILFGTDDGRLVALDATTGRPVAGFGTGGTVDLRQGVAERIEGAYGITSPPAIYKDLVIVGSQVPEASPRGPSGDVRAFDVRTGRLVWQFHTVPRPGEVGHDTWAGDSWRERSGTNVWSMMSVDVDRGLVFLPIGSPSSDFYGGDRPGQNLFGNSLVALNAATGKRLWHYQMVHHDIWDYDLPAQPVLSTVRRDGREIPAVTQVTKMGFVFVLDRLTGQPLFPVEERPVPKSHVPGEAAWPTQPFPLKPPPLARLSITRDDITDVTPETKKYCTELFESLVGGTIFTPYGSSLTLTMPGTLGGANWSGASYDPSSRHLYVNVNEVGGVGRMQPQPAGSPVPYRRTSQWGEYARFWDPNGYPCQRPPWGTLNAIDLNTGEIAWTFTLGVVDALAANGVNPTGTPNLGGSIVTAGGLVFIAATSDRRFRAFDARTGTELWVARLPASGYATPMTYLGKRSGKQFVVIAAGGGGYFSEEVSDSLVAYALPN